MTDARFQDEYMTVSRACLLALGRASGLRIAPAIVIGSRTGCLTLYPRASDHSVAWQEYNDVQLTSYLASLTRSLATLSDVSITRTRHRPLRAGPSRHS